MKLRSHDLQLYMWVPLGVLIFSSPLHTAAPTASGESGKERVGGRGPSPTNLSNIDLENFGLSLEFHLIIIGSWLGPVVVVAFLDGPTSLVELGTWEKSTKHFCSTSGFTSSEGSSGIWKKSSVSSSEWSGESGSDVSE